ncbi:MAG: hypothetical protein BGO31_01630 [Bacteroidetes bacterium 43-16]|nr:MAG: hypothetical protein BGO31_01630 [Bacteroidetes bacterium 43-16]
MELFMVILGGKPAGRYTEQHDIFFGVAKALKDLVPQMQAFWPELKDEMHIDSWRKITQVAQYTIKVVSKDEATPTDHKLFFVNLGGYKPNDMEEYHYKHLVVAADIGKAIQSAKQTAFWKEHEASHIDDKFVVDIDDIYEVSELLGTAFTEQFALSISESNVPAKDLLQVGYLTLSKLLKM